MLPNQSYNNQYKFLALVSVFSKFQSFTALMGDKLVSNSLTKKEFGIDLKKIKFCRAERARSPTKCPRKIWS